MKAVAAAIAKGGFGEDKLFGGSVEAVEVEGVEVTRADVLVTRSPKAGLVVASQDAVVVGIETALTPELIAEGNAREFVSHVQNMRKEADFEVTQRIGVTVDGDEDMRTALESHREYVMSEILALELSFGALEGFQETDLNGHMTRIKVEKM